MIQSGARGWVGGDRAIGPYGNGDRGYPPYYIYGSSSGGITPVDPSTIAGLKLWLKADAIAGPPADGASISAWNDSSGNGYNLAGTGIFKTGIVNSKPIIRFNGTSNSLYNVSNIGVSQPFTVITVGKQPTAATTHFPFMWNNPLCIFGIINTGVLFIHAGGAGVMGVTDLRGAFHVCSVTATGSNVTGYVDGVVAIPTTADGTNGIGAVTMGSTNDLSIYSTGDIAEMLVYNSALSTTDRQNVENYLKSKYGTP